MILKFCRGIFISVVATLLPATLTSAWAQSAMDPSSALLLNPSSSDARSRATDSRNDSRLDSGRYTVRPRPEARTSPPQPTATPARRPVEAAEPTATPGAVSSKPAGAEESTSVILIPTSDGTVVVSELEKLERQEDSRLFRNRLLEFSIASAYMYENAESGYSYRQATMAGPAYSAAARVWFSPEAIAFGVGGSYFSSLGGQVADGVSAVGASRTATAFGLFVKRAFSKSELIFGVELHETQFKVAGDTVSKVNTKSKGVRLSIEGTFATDANSSWFAGFSISPKLNHEESPAATNAQSGTDVNAYEVGAAIGRRWQFDTANAVFVKLEHRIERDLFTGSASQSDPIGGAPPTGVAATVGTTVIQFGYNWGN